MIPAPDAGQLLGLIVAALLLQAVGVAVLAIRQRQRAADRPDPAATDADPDPSTDLRQPLAWPGTRPWRVVARQHEDLAQTQCSFLLEAVDGTPPPSFRPGQFLTFALDLPDARAPGGQRQVTRCYSLSDRPGLPQLRVTIKRVPAPADHPEWPAGLSSNHFHDQVQVGDILQVRAPSGHFHIDEDASVPAVLVAGGIGITPMVSMLGWLITHQPARPVHLYYGLRSRREHAFQAHLQALQASHPALRLHVVYSRPEASDRLGVDHHHEGHVDLALLQRTLPHGRHRFFICGPGAMMGTLVPALRAWGVPDEDIRFEAFGPASVQRPAATATRDASAARLPIRFQRSGRSLVWDGQDASLLDFAERHAVPIESGCRSGGCGTCATRLIDGRVGYDGTPDHDVPAGHCLPCVARPLTALVLEA
ncbi:2Fe-2S iron-sulfur cluster-binding protein [Leptothrix discophora]|uniref:2Fe-2S iron-sulfur cluster-binding protein n=1 Tax=Leptothrix discophora TaxID=89 RepID=A0ABT9G3Y3_LEPDI|nr:2Fe-2S iron-sulfur cluster-binding protein [Leptothrix discophora]MDP4301199.1 2Fe-2S iron-sulfur cluster-binding protein [Leptothrix discophora]